MREAMAGLLIIPGYQPALDDNGGPIAGARLYVYQNETTTLATVYADTGLTTALPNPVIADASGGFPLLYSADGSAFTVSLTDAQGAPLASYDDVTVSSAAGLATALDFSLLSKSQLQALVEALLSSGLSLPGGGGGSGPSYPAIRLTQPDPLAQHNVGLGWTGTGLDLKVDLTDLGPVALRSDLLGPSNALRFSYNEAGDDAYQWQGAGNSLNLAVGAMLANGQEVAIAPQGSKLQLGAGGAVSLFIFSGATVGQPPPYTLVGSFGAAGPTFAQTTSITGPGNGVRLNFNGDGIDSWVYQGKGHSAVIATGCRQDANGNEVATATQGSKIVVGYGGAITLYSFSGAIVGQVPTYNTEAAFQYSNGVGGMCLGQASAAIRYDTNASKYYWTNAAGQNIASLDSAGNLIVAGQVLTGQP